MFDRAFFRDPFLDRVREFGAAHGVKSVKLAIVTRDGAALDTRELNTGEDGARLITVDEVMIFLPYHEIARVEVLIRRGGEGQLGFQPPGEGEKLTDSM